MTEDVLVSGKSQENQETTETRLLENGWLVRYPRTAEIWEGKKDGSSRFLIRKNPNGGADEPDSLGITYFTNNKDRKEVTLCAQFNTLEVHIGQVITEVPMQGHPYNGERGGKDCDIKCEGICELDVTFSKYHVVVNVKPPQKLPVEISTH